MTVGLAMGRTSAGGNNPFGASARAGICCLPWRARTGRREKSSRRTSQYLHEADPGSPPGLLRISDILPPVLPLFDVSANHRVPSGSGESKQRPRSSSQTPTLPPDEPRPELCVLPSSRLQRQIWTSALVGHRGFCRDASNIRTLAKRTGGEDKVSRRRSEPNGTSACCG